MLPHYLHRFAHLRRNQRRGPAPHKPVLLLAVISLVEEGLMVDPVLWVDDELRFRFEQIWEEVNTTDYAPTLFNPFTRMQSEGFWRLIPKPGQAGRIQSGKAFKHARDFERSVAGASLDAELFHCLQDPQMREQLRQVLWDTYFPEQGRSRPTVYRQPDLDRLALRLAEPPQAVLQTKKALNREEKQEALYFRRSAFATAIRYLYRQRCAISGQEVHSPAGTLLDACHIQPHAQFKDDSLSNGLALSPTLHRAFDMGLIGVDAERKVIVSPRFRENDNPFQLRTFAGKELWVPDTHGPDLERLAWHRKEVFLA